MFLEGDGDCCHAFDADIDECHPFIHSFANFSCFASHVVYCCKYTCIPLVECCCSPCSKHSLTFRPAPLPPTSPRWTGDYELLLRVCEAG